MKKNLPYIAPLCFLIFLLLPVLVATVLQCMQWCLKKTATEREKEKTVVTLTLPAAGVIWEKTGKELRVDGCLFDVKTTVTKGSLLIVTGYFDKEETRVEQLLSFIRSDDQQYGTHLSMLLVWQCLTITISLFSFAFFREASSRLSPFYAFFLPQPFHLVLKRPPRF